ncbi:MAG: hypothetical protein CVU92_10220 [Firmicutes bacterium HGW-Firmicutes-17]|jgi:hypothetical protein|nr:MAG: hypothetical protein CVU92_10220 [Firmicutes bacterium HGW-Firmicutes-17]
MEYSLTKDSDALICLLYKDYCDARSTGTPKDKAKKFGNSRMINDNYVPKWSFQDCLETCRELNRAGLIDCLYGDGEIIISSITDQGIIYMEGRFSRNVSSILDHIKTIKDLVPFV